MIDLVSKRFWYFALSLAVILPGLVSLLIPPGLTPGIEFSSGTTMAIQFEGPVAQDALRAELAAQGHPDAVVQRQKPVSEVALLVEAGPVNYEPEQVKQRLSRRFGKLSDYTVGALLQVQFAGPVSEDRLRAELGRLGHPEATLERRPVDGGERWRIATQSLVAPVTTQELKQSEPGEESKLREALAKRFGEPSQFAAKVVLSLSFEGAVSAEQLQGELTAQGHPEAVVSVPQPRPEAEAGSGPAYTIELGQLGGPRPAYDDKPAEPGEEASLRQALVQRFGPISQFQVTSRVVAAFPSVVSQADFKAELQTPGRSESEVTVEALPQGVRFTSVVTPRLRPPTLAPETITVTPGEDQRLKASLEERFGATASYTSANTYRLKFGRGVTDEELSGALRALGFSDVALQRQVLTQGDAYFLRTRPLKVGERGAQGALGPSERDQLETALRSHIGPITILETATVDPVVAAETVRNAFLAVVVAAAFILLYVWWAFRRLQHAFRYSVAAIIALIHDVLVVLGIFSVLGKVANVEVNAMFITGMLTVVGFSVHDTIVVFDRIRENLGRADAPPFEVAVNNSLLETMGRSLNTSITLLLTLLALLLFGGVTLRNFVLVLFIGVITGTYSSIAIASQLVVSWERGDFARAARFLRRLNPLPGAARSRE
ncbi:MAG: protein translocase subunit SecF [Dehalococcoidia bacterium]|nr:protein translocase subunit SecF [Dehalococcoidia bacterium]